MKINFYHSKKHNQLDMESFFDSLSKKDLLIPPLNIHFLFSSLEKVKEILLKKTQIRNNFISLLKDFSENPENDLNDLLNFISIDHLREKLKRELGDENPYELKRINGRSEAFESWYPLGVVVHITPNNSAILSVCALIEGLLTRNVNLLKLGRKEGEFAAAFFELLCQEDHSGSLKDYIYLFQISSKDKVRIEKLLSLADAISVWGNEESVKAVKEKAPLNTRIIDWGHKISFSLFSKKYNAEDVELLAKEICFQDQQFCSSPQCVYLLDANFEELKSFGQKLEISLKKYATKSQTMTLEERAEITVNNELVRLRAINEECEALVGENYRIYIENNSVLKASPLYKSIWLKPLKTSELVAVLNEFKTYLQTVGLSCAENEYEQLVNLLLLAGALRVRNIGQMLNSYAGEPHDGVYALNRYCKKVSVLDNDRYMKGKYSFEEKNVSKVDRNLPIMTKNDFQNQKVAKEYSDLFFHSGGSSGEPKLSIFTYEDYHRQMEMAAEGLFAAGLNPKTDRTMNLYYAGNLYGGFTSFFTILEKLKAVQFPMGASTDFAMVGNTIVKNNVDTLLGMPSYILELFRQNHELFKNYRGIKKIFFGGEHFPRTQRDYLAKEYGVLLIRASSYGSVDAGPLAFQCQYSEDSIYHLYEKLHDLEVVDLESDTPSSKGEVGRLLFSSKVRHGQKIKRYEIGDIGKQLTEACPCGRTGVRFELLGRHGDIFRIGTIFLSYQRIQKVLINEFGFEGQFQIHLLGAEKNKKEVLQIKVANSQFRAPVLNEALIKNYYDLNTVIVEDKVLELEILEVEASDLVFNEKTGKLKSVIDHR